MDNSIKIESETIMISPIPREEQELEFSNVHTTSTEETITNSSRISVFRRKSKFTNNLSHIHKQKKEKFTLYLKKKFLKFFCEYGCTPESLALCLNSYNVDEDEVKEYFSKAAKEAQQYIHQECDSLSFSNINEWLKYMQTIGAPEECNYEAAIVTNAIANNEDFAEPETIGGINLKSIYKYLSSALMGLPLPALEPASAKFLSNEFKNLINEANTDSADIDVQNMKTNIELILGTTECPQPTSLDSLRIDDDSEFIDNSTEPMLKYTNHVKMEK